VSFSPSLHINFHFMGGNVDRGDAWSVPDQMRSRRLSRFLFFLSAFSNLIEPAHPCFISCVHKIHELRLRSPRTTPTRLPLSSATPSFTTPTSISTVPHSLSVLLCPPRHL